MYALKVSDGMFINWRGMGGEYLVCSEYDATVYRSAIQAEHGLSEMLQALRANRYIQGIDLDLLSKAEVVKLL